MGHRKNRINAFWNGIDELESPEAPAFKPPRVSYPLEVFLFSCWNGESWAVRRMKAAGTALAFWGGRYSQANWQKRRSRVPKKRTHDD